MIVNKNRITQKEVARLANVSQAVVSHVLNNSAMISRIPEETRERVTNVARIHNYRVNQVARQLRSGKSRIVNIICSSIYSHFVENLIPQIEAELAKRNYRCMISRLHDSSPDIIDELDSLMSFDFAGTIALDYFDGNNFGIAGAIAENQNVVFMSRSAKKLNCNMVDQDYASGIIEAVQHLHVNGHRRIALAVNDDLCFPMLGRIDGYKRGLTACGLPFDAKLLWVGTQHIGNAYDGSCPDELVLEMERDIVQGMKADAVICSNDEWAVALVHALKSRRLRVPNDVSVVGYGDDPNLCWACDPNLTTINHGNRIMAENLAQSLFALIDGCVCKLKEPVKSYLVIRNSTKHNFETIKTITMDKKFKSSTTKRYEGRLKKKDLILN